MIFYFIEISNFLGKSDHESRMKVVCLVILWVVDLEKQSSHFKAHILNFPIFSLPDIENVLISVFIFHNFSLVLLSLLELISPQTLVVIAFFFPLIIEVSIVFHVITFTYPSFFGFHAIISTFVLLVFAFETTFIVGVISIVVSELPLVFFIRITVVLF